MPRLNQIIAVVSGQKGRTQKALTTVYHKIQKPELLSGISRKYRPKDEEGEQLPAESKRVQYTVREGIGEALSALSRLWDGVATQDVGNCEAKGTITVEGKPLLSGVPVTHLLFLEKQLTDLHTLVEKLPALDPGEEWTYSREGDAYATSPQETTRTKKVPRSFVKYEATKEHPAQVEVFTEDQVVGYWETVKFSGAVPEGVRREMLGRIRDLQDAVKLAREEANSMEVEQQRFAEPLLRYAFGDFCELKTAASD